ncbi:MAG: hypothetical protein M3N24_00790 [Actinomycetota bacterium]|nr:hypothetical protein [Actinomycetota bacterium]
MTSAEDGRCGDVRRWTILLVAAMAVVVTGCGNDNSRPTAVQSPSLPAPTASPTWAGYPEPEGGLGEISVTEFNAFINATRPPWNTTPLRAAIEFVHGGPPPEALPFTTTVTQEASPEGGTEATVTITEEGLLDDSVAAIRHRLEFQRENDATWRLVSAFVDQRCARGPQTEDFTVEPCP